MQKDKERDFFMEKQGLKTLRFDNLQILQFTKDVMGVIFDTLELCMSKANKPL